MQFGFTSKPFWPGVLLLLQCAAGVSASRAAPAAAQNSANVATQPAANRSGLQSVLAGMDQAALRFASMAADLEYTKVTVIVDDHSTERGRIFFEKSKGKLRVMLAFSSPAEKYVLFQDGK